jgi:hypothetical protein
VRAGEEVVVDELRVGVEAQRLVVDVCDVILVEGVVEHVDRLRRVGRLDGTRKTT